MAVLDLKPNLAGQNAIELDLDTDIIDRGFDQVSEILTNDYFEGYRTCEDSGIELYSYCPQWNGDLCWVSAGNLAGFQFFEDLFEDLNIAGKTQSTLADPRERIMYSGFFVTRSRTQQPYYHNDYSDDVGTHAMTLMTPVQPEKVTGNLLFQDQNDKEQIYQYVRGTAICFGGAFYHSTQPFESDRRHIFLCFTYGVKSMEHWNSIAETVTDQGLLYRHPTRGIVRTEHAE